MAQPNYRAADGRSASLADLIGDLTRLAADLTAAADAGVAPDAEAARGLARVIAHHRDVMSAAVDFDGE